MGFGFLIIGYFLAFLMSNFHSAFAFAGAYLMTIGLWKLKNYKRKFTYTLYPLALFMLLALKDTVLDILSIFGGYPSFFEGAAVTAIFEFLYIASISLFNIMLFISTSELAKDVGLEKIKVSALRNLCFFAIYTVLCAIRFLPVNYPSEFLRYLNLIIQLMQLLWIALAIIMLFSCFRNMVDKDQLEKELAEDAQKELKKGTGGK